MSPLEAATATTQAALFALAVLAAGVVLGWVLHSAWLAVRDARSSRQPFSDEDLFVALLSEVANQLGDEATARFREFGVGDARGAALWDVSALIEEDLIPLVRGEIAHLGDHASTTPSGDGR